jgi:transposase
MIQITPQMRVLVAVESVDFRKGIDGLARVCRAELRSDPMSGTAFVFRNKRKTSLRILLYDGQGFWLATKRLSAGKFRYWPTSSDEPMTPLEAHELQVLLRAGDPRATKAAPVWRRVA